MSTKKTNKTLTVYTQSGCPACKDIKDVLNKILKENCGLLEKIIYSNNPEKIEGLT